MGKERTRKISKICELVLETDLFVYKNGVLDEITTALGGRLGDIFRADLGQTQVVSRIIPE